MSNEQGPTIEQSSMVGNLYNTIKDNAREVAVAGGLTIVALGGAFAVSQGGEEAFLAVAEGVPCDPEMDVCPGAENEDGTPITAPEDAEPVPGNTPEGEEIETDEEFDDKNTTVPTTSTPDTTTTTTPDTTTTTTPDTTTTTVPIKKFCEVGDFDNDGDKDFRFVEIPAEDAIIGVHFDVGSPVCKDVEPVPEVTLPPVVETVPTKPQVTK
jgi:hypothetical protein